ncbi:MAG: adenylosuccinate lyase [Candidatus Omnitrophica bacterium]|nr:adenylosuccinate lyase [Candidatus Omnitrophota bacterium]
MISRYTLPAMGRIWTEDSRFRRMLEVELLACEALVRMGKIPTAAYRRIRRAVRAKGINPARVAQLEATTKHDVVAFLNTMAESLGADARFLHLGLTSSDVLDTATATQLAEACDILIADVDRLLAALRRQANTYQFTLCIGRTHGVHAEPTTFGLKLALAFSEMTRARQLLEDARARVAVGKISGAVGTYAHLPPTVEQYVCKKLKITPAPISTQVVPRDGYAAFMSRLAIIGAMLERLATEIRHLQRTEVLEAEEPFEEGQTGSSAMPHKRNPVSCERVTGLARLLRGYAVTALENVALWHERDISHSSTERIMLPDATCALDFMLVEMTRIVRGLKVYPERMREHLGLTKGLIFSESVLLALMGKGLTRPAAYRLVQRHAMRAWAIRGDFRALLTADPDVRRHLTPRELDRCFDLERHTQHVQRVFTRLGL